MRKDNIFDCEHNRSPAISCTECSVFTSVLSASGQMRMRRVKKNLTEEWMVRTVSQEFLKSSWTFLCFMFWLDSRPTREDRFGWKLQRAYGAALSDSLLWHLTVHGDERLLSNKLSGPGTWHRHLESCWQRFAPPVSTVSQSAHQDPCSFAVLTSPVAPHFHLTRCCLLLSPTFSHLASVRIALDGVFKPLTSSFTYSTLPCLNHLPTVFLHLFARNQEAACLLGGNKKVRLMLCISLNLKKPEKCTARDETHRSSGKSLSMLQKQQQTQPFYSG